MFQEKYRILTSSSLENGLNRSCSMDKSYFSVNHPYFLQNIRWNHNMVHRIFIGFSLCFQCPHLKVSDQARATFTGYGTAAGDELMLENVPWYIGKLGTIPQKNRDLPVGRWKCWLLSEESMGDSPPDSEMLMHIHMKCVIVFIEHDRFGGPRWTNSASHLRHRQKVSANVCCCCLAETGRINEIMWVENRLVILFRCTIYSRKRICGFDIMENSEKKVILILWYDFNCMENLESMIDSTLASIAKRYDTTNGFNQGTLTCGHI